VAADEDVAAEVAAFRVDGFGFWRCIGHDDLSGLRS
jgi:hypothetical protein